MSILSTWVFGALAMVCVMSIGCRHQAQYNQQIKAPMDGKDECLPCNALQKTGPANCNLQETATYTIKIANSEKKYVEQVVIIERLSEGFSFVDANVEPATIDGNEIIWEMGSMSSGSSRTIEITLIAVKSGTWVNTTLMTSKNQSSRTASTITTIK